jgi:hypothetical protein
VSRADRPPKTAVDFRAVHKIATIHLKFGIHPWAISVSQAAEKEKNVSGPIFSSVTSGFGDIHGEKDFFSGLPEHVKQDISGRSENVNPSPTRYVDLISISMRL